MLCRELVEGDHVENGLRFEASDDMAGVFPGVGIVSCAFGALHLLENFSVVLFGFFGDICGC